MGIGLLFKVIPWGEVIAAAPAVVDGARKLWGLARDPKRGPDAAARPLGMDGRVQTLESQVAQLKRENADSTELIKSLAEQNAQLVKAVEILRVRSQVLLAVTLASVTVLVFLMVRVFAG